MNLLCHAATAWVIPHLDVIWELRGSSNFNGSVLRAQLGNKTRPEITRPETMVVGAMWRWLLQEGFRVLLSLCDQKPRVANVQMAVSHISQRVCKVHGASESQIH